MTENWSKLTETKTDNVLSTKQFWTGLRVWIDRPHLLNRKLLDTERLHSLVLPQYRQNLCVEFNETDFQHFLHLCENTNSNKCILSDATEMSMNQYFDVETDSFLIQNKKPGINDNKSLLFLLRKLIPRNLVKFSEVLELVIIDSNLNIIIFWPKESDVINSAITPCFPYRVKFEDNRISIEVYKRNSGSKIKQDFSEKWLQSTVLPKIIKWSSSSCSTTTVPSLNLISSKSYCLIYNSLKEKYAKKYVETWPEISDPLKYVYEDIAIAAYLITIWEKEMKDLNLTSKQSFVDLGCGNGLLVDLLNLEGYSGIGVDVRRRKIWNLYKNRESLIERAIEPSDYSIFPEYDWIIGNHSDELTPWIPVIAARSSYKMRVFLLPCCPFTFNGKYERCSSGNSQYQSYLSFIHSLCENMGFVVNVDRLRIPSTRRTCFVCTSRNYEEGEEKVIDIRRNDFIKSYSRKNEQESHILRDGDQSYSKRTISEDRNVSKDTLWIEDFKPRDRDEVVKNCSQLDKDFLDSFVLTVVNFLLQTENYVSLVRGSETISWNAGGKITLNDLINKIDPQTLKGLKNQNGGIQTFLKMHRHIFQLNDKNIQLNIPVVGISSNSQPIHKRKQRKIQSHFKEKPCFFFYHHPQGCPLEASDCNFFHKTDQ